MASIYETQQSKTARRLMADKLVAYGHSQFKASEIALDYSRGESWAILWVENVCGKQ